MAYWGKAWMDDDGKHVWCSHTCGDKEVTFMMPHPHWKASEDGKTVVPSFVCLACQFHQTLSIGTKP